MASVITLPIALPQTPKGWAAKAEGKLSATKPLPVFPAGPSFISHARRTLQQLSFEEDDKIQAELAEKLKGASSEEILGPDFDGLGEEQEDKDVLEYDPKEWKKQDHYLVLGLGHLRYKANDEHIKVAHRRKVLRHHPDKKASSTGDTNADSFFKCIQKAHEVLTNLERRHQFDSVDPAIDDSVPDAKSVSEKDFIKAFAPVFELEGRFSKKQPVPSIGTMDSSKDEVEGFYDFWYNFDSWRSFEWYDKEVNEGSDSRDDKRYTEKKNKTERAQRKKEDNTRVRELVDAVLAVDPRIKRIRAEEKAARDAKKNKGKGGAAGGAVDKAALAKAAKEKEEAEKKAAEEAKKAQEENKVNKEAAKKAKEAARKNLKKWKKAISTVISGSNYFQPAGTAPSAKVIEQQLAELDSLCELLEPEEVKTLKEKVEAAAGGDAAKTILVESVKVLGDKAPAGKFTQFA